ncbi:MAG: DUF1905 domain-containing protein [Chloracidobacterium sp.]|nr:DUF1905 domain-containing protein [Chloracidobacterium sp.]
MATPVRLRSKVEVTDSTPPWYILRVPKFRVTQFGFKGNLRRVICKLNGSETLQCSLFPAGNDYFITLSKPLRQKLRLEPGDPIELAICKDESKYGMPMPAEFAEVLRQDREGKRMFEALSPGNQRLMLKLVDFVKSVDKRIIRSLTGIQVLKQCEGKFDYHILHDAMRAACLVGTDRDPKR